MIRKKKNNDVSTGDKSCIVTQLCEGCRTM